MSREVHVRFWEGLGLKCPGLLTKEPETWVSPTHHKFALPHLRIVLWLTRCLICTKLIEWAVALSPH